MLQSSKKCPERVTQQFSVFLAEFLIVFFASFHSFLACAFLSSTARFLPMLPSTILISTMLSFTDFDSSHLFKTVPEISIHFSIHPTRFVCNSCLHPVVRTPLSAPRLFTPVASVPCGSTSPSLIFDARSHIVTQSARRKRA